MRESRPGILKDDEEINEKIDDLLAKFKQIKAQKKKNLNAFKCPYCSRQYASENLKHLLGCAQTNPNDKQKLEDFSPACESL